MNVFILHTRSSLLGSCTGKGGVRQPGQAQARGAAFVLVAWDSHAGYLALAIAVLMLWGPGELTRGSKGSARGKGGFNTKFSYIE